MAGGQNSGLNRFVGNANPYLPPAYTPQTFQPRMTWHGGNYGQSQSPGLLGGGMSGGDNGGAGYSGQTGGGAGGFGGLLGGNMGPGGSSMLGNMGLSPMGGATRGYAVGGPLGGLLGGLIGYGSQAAHAADPTNPSSVNAVNGMDLQSDQASAGFDYGGMDTSGMDADAAQGVGGYDSGSGGGGDK